MHVLLLTGATGFLGHHLLPRLQRAGYNVRALARPGSNAHFIEESGAEIVTVSDIGDSSAVERACRGCRYVVHAAAHFRMWGSFLAFWQTNVAGTATVLEAARRAGVKRLVHVSSVVVVGRPGPARVIDEDTPCRPQDYYQRSKLEGEKLALAYCQHASLPVVIVRPGALYGAWGRYAFNRLFFEDPLRGWRIKVNGGRRVTFPAYAPDVAAGIVTALQEGRAGTIYNLSGQSLTHNAVNDIVSDLAGISRYRLNVPTPLVLALARVWTALSRYTGREPFYPINLAHYVFQDWVVSSARAEAELSFKTTPFRRGAQETLEWYRRRKIL